MARLHPSSVPAETAVATSDEPTVRVDSAFDAGLAALVRLLARQAAREHCNQQTVESSSPIPSPEHRPPP